MKIVSETPDTLVIEGRHGFALFVALIVGLLLIKSGLSSFVAAPGVLTGLWFAALTAAALGALWALSERVTLSLDPDALHVTTGRLGASTTKTWPVAHVTGAQAATAKGPGDALELTLEDEGGTRTVLRPGSAPRTKGAADAAQAINRWLAARRDGH